MYCKLQLPRGPIEIGHCSERSKNLKLGSAKQRKKLKQVELAANVDPSTRCLDRSSPPARVFIMNTVKLRQNMHKIGIKRNTADKTTEMHFFTCSSLRNDGD